MKWEWTDLLVTKRNTGLDCFHQREKTLRVLNALLPPALSCPKVLALRCTGFLTKEDLDCFYTSIGDHFHSSRSADSILLDLGCGTGGLGQYLSQKLGCGLIGLDGSLLAIRRARKQARQSKFSPQRFIYSDFTKTRLPRCSVSAIISLDALYLAPDPVAALLELRRILMKGGPLLFTTYEAETQYPGANPLWPDWKPFLRQADFSVKKCLNVSQTWRKLMQQKHQNRWNARNHLFTTLGPSALPELSVSAAMLGLEGRPSFLKHVKRYLILAE
jgi:SAM-dependent methyltransferase